MHLRKFLPLVIFISFCPFAGFAQSGPVRKYFDSTWKPAEQQSAVYYYIFYTAKDNVFKRENYKLEKGVIE